jgi:hypothetical protein
MQLAGTKLNSFDTWLWGGCVGVGVGVGVGVVSANDSDAVPSRTASTSRGTPALQEIIVMQRSMYGMLAQNNIDRVAEEFRVSTFGNAPNV